ncbi:MAG: hypothetical protein JXO22_17030 [Phycisphaerae bacterium]|nr:hypothetical protein [Phycisphaerae bacterium]
MSEHISNNAALAVIKIGGSILVDKAAYARVAESIQQRLDAAPHERLVIVVSAEFGTTDRLEKLARDICPQPDRATMDLLWSTGELRSVALLTLHLQGLGIAAAGLNVHQCGLAAHPTHPDGGDVSLSPLRLRCFLSRNTVVTVPGFLARGALDAVVSLGRGGSDLTAVLLAAALGASRCELVKDVPGYYSKDPHVHADAEFLPHLSTRQAREMALRGCDLVQLAAIDAAARHGLPLLVRTLAELPGSLVTDHGEEAARVAS